MAEDRSISHVANNFIGTGACPPNPLVLFIIVFWQKLMHNTTESVFNLVWQ